MSIHPFAEEHHVVLRRQLVAKSQTREQQQQVHEDDDALPPRVKKTQWNPLLVDRRGQWFLLEIIIVVVAVL
jgi:hypothetical protein